MSFISCCANACGETSASCAPALFSLLCYHPIPPLLYLHPFLKVHLPLLSSQPQSPAPHPESTPRGLTLGTALHGILTSLPSTTLELRSAERPALAPGGEGQRLPDRCSNKRSLIKRGSGAGWRAPCSSTRQLPRSGRDAALIPGASSARGGCQRRGLPAPPTPPRLQDRALPLARLQACCPRPAVWPFSPRFAASPSMLPLPPTLLSVPPQASPDEVPAEPASLGGRVTFLPSADKPQGPARLCPRPRLAPEEWDCREAGKLDFRGLATPERCRLPIYIPLGLMPHSPQCLPVTGLGKPSDALDTCLHQQLGQVLQLGRAAAELWLSSLK